jgi:hypothetical protein
VRHMERQRKDSRVEEENKGQVNPRAARGPRRPVNFNGRAPRRHFAVLWGSRRGPWPLYPGVSYP